MAAPKNLPWLAIALGLLALCAIFAQEVQAAIGVWSTSTAYGHCWLVLPIVAWLLWEREDVFHALKPRPAWWPSLLALPLIVAWVVADWLGIMEGRQLAVIGFAEILLVSALGFRMFWALSPGFLYAVFLVPFGAFLTPALQNFTAGFITGGLKVLRIPFEANAFQISIPEGAFYVAEACAGLRFLIAAIAFGVLYAVTMFRSPWRRAAFIAVSCVVPVVANGVRGLGIVLLGHVLGSAQAGAADHLIYGWVFFSAVILLLAAAGLPFREAPAPTPAPDNAPTPRLSRLAGCMAVVALAVAAPVTSWALLLAHPRATEAVLPKFVMPEGCTADAPEHPSAAETIQAFECGAQTVQVTTYVLPRGANPARILEAARTSAAAGLQGEIDTQTEHVRGAPWVVMTARDLGGVAAYAVWIDGAQAAGGLHDRLKMARDLFTPGPPPVAVSVAVAPGHAGAREVLQGFLLGIR